MEAYALSALLRCPKFVARFRSPNFDRGHSLASLYLPPAALGTDTYKERLLREIIIHTKKRKCKKNSSMSLLAGEILV